MILCPRRSERRAGAVKNLVCSVGQNRDRFRLNTFRVVQVDLPAPCTREVGEYLAIHDSVGAGLVRNAHLDGDVVGKIRGPDSHRDRLHRLRQRRGKAIQCGRSRASNRSPHLGDERTHARDVVMAAVIVNRCGRHSRLDEFDASTVDDPMVGGSRNDNSPTEMIGDANAHRADYSSAAANQASSSDSLRSSSS